ncbi:ester cyclase [Methylobacterium radiotolerans]|nr:ester cyclase [Methylobacterium radiotolerans]
MSFDRAKAVVRQFNEKVIVGGDRAAFEALIAPDFVNRSVPQGSPNGPESMWNTFQNMLRPALAELSVTIHDQVGEGDKVTTRKTISGKHVGPLLGVEATNRQVSIEVIDIVRVEDGRYVEHWGINNLPAVLASLRQA